MIHDLDLVTSQIDLLFSKLPSGLAPKKEVLDLAKQMQSKFFRLFLDSAVEQQKKFQEKFDGHLLDVTSCVLLGCLLADKEMKSSVSDKDFITIESTKKELKQTFTKFAVKCEPLFEMFERLEEIPPKLEEKTDDGKKIYRLKISLDGRQMKPGLVQVLVGLVPLVPYKKRVSQNPHNYIPLALVNTKESKELSTLFYGL